MYTYTPDQKNKTKPHTHTWAWVETELRGTLQGVDEWGLAKLPRGVQISSIHKQHSGPCGEGWGEGVGGLKRVDRKKEKFTTHGGEEKGKQEVSARVIGKICEVK